MWVLDHLDDLEADFLVFYGMHPQDILALSGPRFFALAYRAGAYDGAVAARIAQQEPAGPAQGRAADKTVEGSRAALQADPALAGVIDFG